MAEAQVPWRAAAPKASIEAGLTALSQRLEVDVARRSVDAPSAKAPPAPSGHPAPSSGHPDPRWAEDHAKSRRLLARSGVDPELGQAVRAHLEQRYRKDADGSGRFVDGPHLASLVLEEGAGLKLPPDLEVMVVSGPRVPFRPGVIRGLRPGDLLFNVTHAGIPRSVMVYLGGGVEAHATQVRGVVVSEVPKKLPDYMYMVAVRPSSAATFESDER